MKRLTLFSLFMWLLFRSFSLHAQSTGEELFNSTCKACHTINQGKLIGPDLAGVNKRRDKDWLISFIRASQKMVSAGDSLAVALFEEYNKIPMPDNNLGDDEILSILSYIEETSSGTPAAEAPTEKQLPDTATQVATLSYSSDLLKRGKALFYGYEEFANGASSCNACHYIQDASLIGGGKLSFDLTASYGRLGEAGIQAILTNPPFPAMNTAFRNKNLTDEEKEAITAMLHFTNDRFAGKPQTSKDGLLFFMLSLVLAMFLLVHLYVLYDNRKLPS
jgi:mono/diheme cytochrome c family protein